MHRSLAPLALLALVLVIVACATPSSGTSPATAIPAPQATATSAGTTKVPPTQVATSSGQVEITSERVGLPDASKSFSVHLHIAFSQDSTVKAYAEAARQRMTEWVQAHPEWAVETRIFSNSVASLPGLLEEARAGRGADCANIVPEYFPLFKNAGYLQPITQYFTPEEMQDFFPYVRNTVTLDGEVYAYWFYTDERVIYRRTDLVPDAPTTWDELQAAALEATKKDPKVAGFLFNGGRWAGTWADWIAYFWGQGGELTDKNNVPIFAEGQNREYMLNVLNFIKGLVDSGASPERVANITTYSTFIEEATAGTVAMFMATDSQYAQLKQALPEEEFAKWQVSPLPGRVAGESATTAGGWSFGVLTPDPEKAAACMDFLKFVYGPEFNAATGLLPSRASTYKKFDRFSEPFYQTLAKGLEKGHPQPILPYTPALSAAFQVMVGDVLTGAATPEQALDTMATEAKAAYEQTK